MIAQATAICFPPTDFVGAGARGLAGSQCTGRAHSRAAALAWPKPLANWNHIDHQSAYVIRLHLNVAQRALKTWRRTRHETPWPSLSTLS